MRATPISTSDIRLFLAGSMAFSIRIAFLASPIIKLRKQGVSDEMGSNSGIGFSYFRSAGRGLDNLREDLFERSGRQSRGRPCFRNVRWRNGTAGHCRPSTGRAEAIQLRPNESETGRSRPGCRAGTSGCPSGRGAGPTAEAASRRPRCGIGSSALRSGDSSRSLHTGRVCIAGSSAGSDRPPTHCLATSENCRYAASNCR